MLPNECNKTIPSLLPPIILWIILKFSSPSTINIPSYLEPSTLFPMISVFPLCFPPRAILALIFLSNLFPHTLALDPSTISIPYL